MASIYQDGLYFVFKGNFLRDLGIYFNYIVFNFMADSLTDEKSFKVLNGYREEISKEES